MGKISVEELVKKVPKEAARIEKFAEMKCKTGIAEILFKQANSFMNAELFIIELQAGNVKSVLKACRQASEIRGLACRVMKEW